MTVLPRRLHLGAFDQVHEGWVNTDITPHMLVARVPGLPWILYRLGVIGSERYASYRAGTFRQLRYLDVSRRFRFPDAAFECVFASNLLEHLHPDVAANCLREVHRVLVPGGVVRLVVPDLDRVVAEYDPADPEGFLYSIYQARGSRDKRSARHWWHYNAGSLEALLRGIGFREVARREFGQGQCPDVTRIDNRPWSLFMEAVK